MVSDEITPVLERLEEDRVRSVLLQFSDLEGKPKNVAIPTKQVEKALTGGISFDGSSIQGFARLEESDMVLRPEISTYQVIPWSDADYRVARFICNVYTTHGDPFTGDPRYILREQMAKASALGYTFNVGPEMEFFLFRQDEFGRPTVNLQDHGGYFDQTPTDPGEDVRRDLVTQLSEMGFNIEASHHEVAPSQHEIDFTYGDALSMADKVVTFKFAAKTLALKRGLHATFMPKPIYGINGSGMHVNCSLMKDGKNVFFDPEGEHQLSDDARYFIGGLLKHVEGITRIANPTVNSYKRLIPGYEAPVYIGWSTMNRSALIRVPSPRGKSTRAELRSPDPTCNPYLTFAVMLAAGMEGITQKIEPPESIDKNIFKMSEAEREAEGIRCLPQNLKESNKALMADSLLCSVLGEHVVSQIQRLADLEWSDFSKSITDWEIKRYLATY
ncbi:MAG TPA: type I glutamate--ammonia ligase [Methanocorpusculum sp.]|jgi:glutamine synthetase|nr:type I glutamate--ammonia ligase [Methanocorpusculum sp.]MBR5815616.1 type I glutamate--ammonia ligase [Methanocorpusculaceae archaeon]MBR5008813.1 type I glutamate--ammonia ligase [Methanocorpusculum sp.]MBR5450718.1 type I glutamate--ammonia ligase [Methanocorpusculum sp.]HJJ65175.1 type I glutamate--ammonia ligase [Methanocorpusculum sp.]